MFNDEIYREEGGHSKLSKGHLQRLGNMEKLGEVKAEKIVCYLEYWVQEGGRE